MNLYRIVYLLSFFLLFSCADDSSIDMPENFTVNEEVALSSNGFYPDSMLTEDAYHGFFPLQMFDKDALYENKQLKEIAGELKSYTLYTDFTPVPYVEYMTGEEDGVVSFAQYSGNLFQSEEWEVFSKNEYEKSHLVAYGVYDTPDDAKQFFEDSSLSSLLNVGDSDYLFLAKVISSKFSVLVDVGLLDRDDVVYINSVTFGKYAYLVIPTNDPENVIDIFINGVLKDDADYIPSYINICSSVNVIQVGAADSAVSYLGEGGFSNMVDIFDLSIFEDVAPIYFDLKDPISQQVITGM